MTRAAAILTLAVLMALGVSGVAWAAFTGSSSSPANVSTLLLQPPSAVVLNSCTGTSPRTLGVRFTGSPSVQLVANRPPPQVLTYDYSVSTSGLGGSVTGTLTANSTSFTATRNFGNGGADRAP